MIQSWVKRERDYLTDVELTSIYFLGQLRKTVLKDLAAFIYNEMSDLEIYRDGRNRQSPNHSTTVHWTDVPGKIEEVRQVNQEESKISLEIVENIDKDTEPPKKSKRVLQEDSVIYIKKKEALGLC